MTMSTPHIREFFDSDTSTMSYLVSDPVTKDTVIIDPVLDYDVLRSQTSTDSAGTLMEAIEKDGLVVRAILETHAHADHLSAAQFLARRYRAPVGIGAGIAQVQQAFAKILHLPAHVPTDGLQFDLLLEAGRVYDFGSLQVKTLATPGHTPACLSYLIGDAVFTGDALFIEDYGTGRTDFPAGSARSLFKSIKDVLYQLPGETRVFVGHDYQPGERELRFESTIAKEKSLNVQLNERTLEDEFVRFRDARDTTLPPPRLIFQSIQVNAFGGRLPEAEENGTRYLKIPLNMRKPSDEVGAPAPSRPPARGENEKGGD